MEREQQSHDFVEYLQQALVSLGFPVTIDGLWGNETDDALDFWAADNPEIAGVTDEGQARAAIGEAERREAESELPFHPPVIFRAVPPAPLLPELADPIWPLRSTDPDRWVISYRSDHGTHGRAGRRFGAGRTSKRKTPAGEIRRIRRFHCGVDLFANEGDEVIAVEPGEVVNRYIFVKGQRQDGSRYAVACLLIKSLRRNVVINYGEVDNDSCTLSRGDRVAAGDVIARVGKMRISSMLHLECYRGGETRNRRWYQSRAAPRTLLDPTLFLLDLRHRIVGEEAGS